MALPMLFAGTPRDSSAHKAAIEAQSASITVLTPNGGEMWQVGQREMIAWDDWGVWGDVLIELYRRGNILVRSIYRSSGNGPATWTVPAYIQPGNDYFIKISSIDDPSVYDYSDGYFTIESGIGPDITITAPSGGERWGYGETVEITWDAQYLRGDVRIDILRGIAQHVYTIASYADNDGSYSWQVSRSIDPGDDFYLSVRSVDDPSVWDTGNWITIGYPEGQANTEWITRQGTGGAAWDVALAGVNAYVADEVGLRIVYFTAADGARQMGYLPLPSNVRDVAVSGSYAYLISSPFGLYVIDVTDPSNPTVVGTFETPSEAFGIAVDGDRAYVADGLAGLHVLDVSNPRTPRRLGTINTYGSAVDVEVSGDYAYVADLHGGLAIIDVSDPARPREAGFYDTSGDTWDVAIGGTLAYLAVEKDGLVILDVTSSRDPRRVGTSNTQGETWDVVVEGSYAYLADGEQGLRIVDVADPGNPREVGYYRTPDVAYGVAVSRGIAYVAAQSSGLYFVRNLSGSGQNSCDEKWPDRPGEGIFAKVVAPAGTDLATVTTDEGTAFSLVDVRSCRERTEHFFFLEGGVLESAAKRVEGEQRGAMKRIELYDTGNRMLGHIPFEPQRSDLPVDAILYVHTNPDVAPQPSRYPGWSYYSTEGELPVSMLIPPGGRYDPEELRPPLLMVHGVDGTFPYWGATPATLNEQYATWQFYYPNDQQIERSAILLGGTLAELTSPDGLMPHAAHRRIPVVAHSMGGLVARTLIQSGAYEQNISKLLMLGTPNHGTYSAFRAAEQAGTRLFGEVFGKDGDAPAYAEMIPGSEFLLDVNGRPIRPLYEGAEIDTTYLVVAGTEDFSMILPHDEIGGQDDGLVAVSSASLLAYGVPLATVNLSHTNPKIDPFNRNDLKEETTDLIRRFLHGAYAGATCPDLGSVVTGFWRDGGKPSCLGTVPGFSTHKGILVLRMPGLETERFLVARGGGNGWLYLKGVPGIPGLGEELVRVPSTFSNYFYRNRNATPNEIGLDLKEGRHGLALQRFSLTGWKTYKEWTFDFKPLQTNVVRVDASAGERAIANAAAIAVPSAVAAKATGGVAFRYEIDPFVDESVFWLIADGEAPWDLHGMQLVAPSGEAYDSLRANWTPGMEFKEGASNGFAFFYVEKPEPGVWHVSFSDDDLSGVTLTAPVMSDLSVAVTFPDTTYRIGDGVDFSVSAPTSVQCSDQRIAATLAWAPSPGVSFTSRGAITLEPATGVGYQGGFAATTGGMYLVSVDFSCSVDGQEVRRQTSDMIAVQEPFGVSIEPERRTAPQAFGLEPNYPNPFHATTEITYLLPRAQNVSLRVVDLLGREVVTLVQGRQLQGRHSVTFDGSRLAGGVYFVIFGSEAYSTAMPMLLLR